jgi:tetrahydromethanopterin:alpha-L-glutamate ligase
MEIVEASNADELLPAFFEQQRVIYIQEFIPNDGRDIRAFVVGDEVVASVYRVAREGQWRTNVARGSSCQSCELSADVRDLCIAAAKTSGLEYTGIDVMEGPDGPVILEVNGAPWWQGLLEATGRNVAMDIVKHVVKLLHSGRPARRPLGF